MIPCALCIHVSTNRLKRSAANAADKVCPVPEQWLGVVKLFQMFCKSVSCSACAGRLEIVDQYRYIQCRMYINQKMHMVGFATKLNQFATPSFEYFAEGGFEVFQQFRRKYFTAIFRYKNDM